MTVVKPQSKNLIDILSTGYRVLNRRLWIILIPVIVDLYLWFGTPLSLAPFLSNLHNTLQQATALITTDLGRQEELLLTIQNADMRTGLVLFNYVPLIFSQTLFPHNTTQSAIYMHELSGVLIAALIINSAALLISSIYLMLLAGGVRYEKLPMRGYIKRILIIAWNICGYFLTLVGLGLLLGLPFLVLSAILVALAPSSATIVILIWYIIIFWTYVYTGFAVEAILISRVDPIRAIYHSVNIVQRNMVSTLGLLFLDFVIIAGMSVIWRNLANTSWGMMLAIGASAYVSSGLVMARLIFYKDRLNGWRRSMRT